MRSQHPVRGNFMKSGLEIFRNASYIVMGVTLALSPTNWWVFAATVVAALVFDAAAT